MAIREESRLLLDTHVLLWLLIGSPHLQQSRQRSFIESAAERDSLFISAASVWEIAAMEQQRVLRLTMPTDTWLQRVAQTPGLNVIAVDREIACAAATLPDEFGGDLADRCIVASARTRNCLLISADPVIHAYAARGYVRADGVEG